MTQSCKDGYKKCTNWGVLHVLRLLFCSSKPVVTLLLHTAAHFRPGREEKIGSATSLRTVIKATWSSNPKKEKPSCGTIIFLTKKRVNMCHLVQHNERYHRIKKQSIILFKYSATGMFFVAFLSFPTFRGFRYPGNFCLRNPESWKLLFVESWIRLEDFTCGIQNPWLWNPGCSSRNPDTH